MKTLMYPFRLRHRSIKNDKSFVFVSRTDNLWLVLNIPHSMVDVGPDSRSVSFPLSGDSSPIDKSIDNRQVGLHSPKLRHSVERSQLAEAQIYFNSTYPLLRWMNMVNDNKFGSSKKNSTISGTVRIKIRVLAPVFLIPF